MPDGPWSSPAVIAEAFQLGPLTDPPIVIKSGTVDVWRVVTAEGDFHVKRFREGRWEWLRQSLAACAEVELGAQRAGVDMAEPIALNVAFETGIVSIHRWREGRPLFPNDDVAAWLGATLAKHHAVPAPASGPPDALASYYGFHPANDWREWFAEGEESELLWAGDTEALEAVLSASEIIAAGLARQTERVGAHRDLHGQNVLTDGARCILIDWDCAGPEVPWFETVRAANEFGRLAATRGGVKPLNPDPAVARAVIASYVAAGGDPGIGGRDALAGVFGMMLWRISNSMWRSLGHRGAELAEREHEAAYVAGALPKLKRRLQELDDLVVLLGV